MFLERDDPPGSLLEAAQVFLRVARVGGTVSDDGEALAQGDGEFLEKRIHTVASAHGRENRWNPSALPLA